jgi:hypothetical protein
MHPHSRGKLACGSQCPGHTAPPAIRAPRQSLTILDLVVLTALMAMVMTGLRPPTAPIAGALVFFLLLAGSLIWWLSGLEVRSKWADAFVALGYIALVLITFSLYGLVFVVAPVTLVLIIAVQFLALLYVSFRE